MCYTIKQSGKIWKTGGCELHTGYFNNPNTHTYAGAEPDSEHEELFPSGFPTSSEQRLDGRRGHRVAMTTAAKTTVRLSRPKMRKNCTSHRVQPWANIFPRLFKRKRFGMERYETPRGAVSEPKDVSSVSSVRKRSHRGPVFVLACEYLRAWT